MSGLKAGISGDTATRISTKRLKLTLQRNQFESMGPLRQASLAAARLAAHPVSMGIETYINGCFMVTFLLQDINFQQGVGACTAKLKGAAMYSATAHTFHDDGGPESAQHMLGVLVAGAPKRSANPRF